MGGTRKSTRAWRELTSSLLLVGLAAGSSGCFWLALGGGAAGGYYVAKDEREVGTIVSDATITTRVKTKLIRDGDVTGRRINVDTRERVVTLRGYVPSQTMADRAVGVARSVSGVHRVESKLVVEPGG